MILLWGLGGVDVFLLRDILLLFVVGITAVLINLPITRWLGMSNYHWVNTVWSFVVVITIITLFLFVIPPFSISRQTTYLTEPRSTEFYGIDYLAAIEKRIEPANPPEDNGFRLLLEKFGRPLLGQYFKDEHWNRLCTKLKLPVQIEPELSFITWWSFVAMLPDEERKRVNSQPTGDILLPWSEEVLPIVKSWLEQNEKPFELFVEAIHKPVFYTPPRCDDILSQSVFLEKIVRALSGELGIRIRYRLAIGEVAAAWDDVMLQFRLVEMRRPMIWNTTLLLVNRALLRGAAQSAESVLFYGNLNNSDVRQKILEMTPFLRHLTETEIKFAFLGSRFIYLDMIRKLSSGTWAADDFIHTFPKTKSNDFNRFIERQMFRISRWEDSMKDINQSFDEIDEKGFEIIATTKFPSNRKHRFLKLVLWSGILKAIPNIMVALCLNNESLFDSIQRLETNIAFTRLIFALELYRREHNDKMYPESLKQLRNDFIDGIPVDPFSKQPFRYVLDNDKRGCLIYSVGTNGVDENGRGWNETPRGDDIRRYLPPK
jgi:hypothetical protein